jgi:hypothetical protein
METVNNTEVTTMEFKGIAQGTKQVRKQVSNKRYRTTSKGWLRNYYSRLKARVHDITMYSPVQFVEAAHASNSFLAAWAAYVESGFNKSYAPRLQSFTMGEGANLPACFYA